MKITKRQLRRIIRETVNQNRLTRSNRLSESAGEWLEVSNEAMKLVYRYFAHILKDDAFLTDLTHREAQMLAKAGMTNARDIYRYISLGEDFNPDMREELALKLMRDVLDKYPGIRERMRNRP